MKTTAKKKTPKYTPDFIVDITDCIDGTDVELAIIYAKYENNINLTPNQFIKFFNAKVSEYTSSVVAEMFAGHNALAYIDGKLIAFDVYKADKNETSKKQPWWKRIFKKK